MIKSDDAAKVLNQAILYAFIGPKELQFISVFKSTGERIVQDPATYDVTVLKVDYSVSGNDKGESAAAPARVGESDSVVSEGNDGSSSPLTASSSSSWLELTLIDGASVLVLVSSDVAFIPLMQCHMEDGLLPENNSKMPYGGSPQSPYTAPITPSHSVFMDRFKNRMKLYYAGFEDDEHDEAVPWDEEDHGRAGPACDADAGTTMLGVVAVNDKVMVPHHSVLACLV